VLHIQSVSPFDIEFSLRATGVHPQGVDGDSDGVADTVDNCPSVPNPWQENNAQPETPAGNHCEDLDSDGVYDAFDNCPYTPNPTQTDSDGDGFGDACDGCQAVPDYVFDDADKDCIPDSSDNCPNDANDDQDDADGDGIGDACDSGDTDFDSVSDETEYRCRSPRDDGSLVPERVDGPFTGTNDDGDWLIDEALPVGARGTDCDGDGFTGLAERHVFGGLTNRDQDSCGTDGWPADLDWSGAPLDSVNRITVTDLTSFLAPVRYLGTDVGTITGDVRWDLARGAGIFGTDINVSDLTALIAGPTAYPPMLGGVRAMGGPVCPWPP
jgi:hypothetical protein